MSTTQQPDDFHLEDWIYRPDWLRNKSQPHNEKQTSNVISFEQYRREKERREALE